jgi:hypothetical protein
MSGQPEESMSSMFSRIVTREKVLSFKVDSEFWTDNEQSQLHEFMILAWKENPDWTEEEATEAMREQVEELLYRKFRQHFGVLINEASVYGMRTQDAFKIYRQKGVYALIKELNELTEFTKFCHHFYDDLRELWNIDTVGVEEEFQKMKQKGWSFRQYRVYLDSEKRNQRMT